jgi:hypothetical protein
MSTTTVTMSSLKQAIVNAIMEVTSNPAYASGKNYESAEAARDDFVKHLLAVLFPENPGMEMPPVVVKEEKVKKPRAKKAAKAVEAEAPVAEAPAVAEAVTVPVVEETAPVAEKVKKPRAKKPKAEAPAEGSNAAAPAPEKEKKARKPKDTDGAVKLTAAQVTKAKEIAKTVGVEFDKKAFLAWMGQLTEEERREPLEVMVRTYLSPAKSSAPAEPDSVVYKELDMTAVMFEGEEYWVHAESGVVYKTVDEVDVKVGMVGQAKFEHMVVPAE